MELDSLLVDKLAIARELPARASAVSAEPNILGPALGVSLAQDALELILRGVADHHRVTLGQRANFEEVIREIGKTLCNEIPVSVPHQPRLTQINKTRVNFKHHGVIPDAVQARNLVAFASVAAEDICKDCLGISLWEVTAVRLIRKARVRNHLASALHHQAGGNLEQSCLRSGIAFALVFGGVKSRRFQRSRELGANINKYGSYGASDRPSSRAETDSLARAVKEDMSDIADEVHSLQRQIDLLKLGINLDALLRFESMLPDVDYWHGRISIGSYGRHIFTMEDATFCVQFALDSILKGQGEINERRPTKQYVEVIEETPILASFPQPKVSTEEIVIAEKGDRYPLQRSENLGGEVVEIIFEGDTCYVASAKIKIIPTQRSP